MVLDAGTPATNMVFFNLAPRAKTSAPELAEQPNGRRDPRQPQRASGDSGSLRIAGLMMRRSRRRLPRFAAGAKIRSGPANSPGR